MLEVARVAHGTRAGALEFEARGLLRTPRQWRGAITEDAKSPCLGRTASDDQGNPPEEDSETGTTLFVHDLYLPWKVTRHR